MVSARAALLIHIPPCLQVDLKAHHNPMDELSCSLGPLELRARRRAMEALARDALVHVDSWSGGARLCFRATPGVGEALADLVLRERECCPFLDLRVVARADALVLEVSAPLEAQATLEGMLEGLSCSM